MSEQGEPFYFEGVMSFEAVWERFGEQDKVVGIGVLVRMLVGCHSPARGLYELHMGWGLLVEPLDHSQNLDGRDLN